MKKLIITLIVIGIIIAAGMIILKRVDWGRLGIVLLRRMSRCEITYEAIEGNLFQGYDIKNYVVKISKTDSLCGRFARISYRFSPWNLRLPAVFQITLVEPTLYLKQKKGETVGGGWNIPTLSLSLRVNLKNGSLVYEDTRKYEIVNISGLIFLDFIGKSLYLSTVNLSLYYPDLPLEIYSANTLLNINSDRINLKSLQIKGRGFTFQSEGSYYFTGKNLLLKIKKGEFDLAGMRIYKGNITLQGDISLIGTRIIPRIQGQIQNFDFLERVNFETNLLADTVIVNLFEGNALQGSFSAQIKFLDLKNYQFETNFRAVNISQLLKLNKPIRLNGKLFYKNKRFSGILNSPAENGLAIDTLLIAGKYDGKQLVLDTFKVEEDDLDISLTGKIAPDLELNGIINKLALERLENFYPVRGTLSGRLQCSGKFFELVHTTFNADLKIADLGFKNLHIEDCAIKIDNFNPQKYTGTLQCDLTTLGYKNYKVEQLSFKIQHETFQLRVERGDDTLIAKGKLYNDATGLIDSLCLIFHKQTMYNLEPIAFDIGKRKIGLVHLKLAQADLIFSLEQNKILIQGLNLEEFTHFLGLKETIRGYLTLILEKDLLTIHAESLFYRGLANGRLEIKGEYLKNRLRVIRLELDDDNKQMLNGEGILSPDYSAIQLKFQDIQPWVFPFLYSFMENPDCRLSGELAFEGNLKDFKIAGDAEIKDACFGIKTIAARFDSGYAKVKFRDTQIIFETIKVQMLPGYVFYTNNRSWVEGGGIVKLEPKFRVRNLRFDFSFRDAPLQFQHYAYGIGSGNFALRMNDEVMAYEGNITIKEGIIPVEFGTYLESGEGEGKQEWRMNLRLSGERNIWLRNRDTDIEFGGEVYLTKELTSPLYVTGNLETKRGNYYWLNHILRITRGKITFVPQEVIDPELDFWAELNTRERDPETNQEIKIILHCTGNISEPVFEFFSEPPRYSEQDILTFLNLNITWREIESMKQGEYIGRVLPRAVWAYLESDVSRRFRTYTGLDYFRIEAPLFEPQEKTRVTVGKYISRNLFITYTYDITTFSNEFNVEYFIDDRNQIWIKRDETGEYSLQYQYRIRF